VIEGGGGRGKPLTADYVLTYRNTPLAVVEAKPDTAPLSEGVAQAKDYAGKLRLRFTYASNGLGVYAIDMASGEEGEVEGFPTPEQLWNRSFAEENAWRDHFAAIPYADKGGSWQIRFYQDIAVSRALEAIATGHNRILLTMATGTGKTSIAFQIIWKLFQARWNISGQPTRRPRILFLADRNTLADQAFNDFGGFAAFEETALARIYPEALRKKGRVPTNASVFLTIFQTLMAGSVVNGKPSPWFGQYPADFVDFVVVDECHRGGANNESTWRDILNYFAPAVQLGLTATPAATTTSTPTPTSVNRCSPIPSRRALTTASLHPSASNRSPPPSTTTSTHRTTRWWRARCRKAAATAKPSSTASSRSNGANASGWRSCSARSIRATKPWCSAPPRSMP
jgi:type I restriction enzyme R subunit